jgi:hypothetical protein
LIGADQDFITGYRAHLIYNQQFHGEYEKDPAGIAYLKAVVSLQPRSIIQQ